MSAMLHPALSGADLLGLFGHFLVLSLLAIGYQFADRQNQIALGEARTLMFDLQKQAEDLARGGRGLPFLDIWR
jgi:hypothetical protein